MTEYEYIYTGTQLTQMIVTTTVDDETPTTETLYFTYETSGPMTVTYNGETYYYAANLQGDVVAILDDSGDAVVEYTYDAWGKLLTTSGDLADTLGETNPLTYRGYVYDTETKFYYLQSRYYDPEPGRFINADAYASTGQGILGNNMFAYCLNNPIFYSDGNGAAAKIQFSDDENMLSSPYKEGTGRGGIALLAIGFGIIYANYAKKPVNLPSHKKVTLDIDHITSGHMPDGPRNPDGKKDVFWGLTTTQVIKAIYEAYQHSSKLKTQWDRIKIIG